MNCLACCLQIAGTVTTHLISFQIDICRLQIDGWIDRQIDRCFPVQPAASRQLALLLPILYYSRGRYIYRQMDGQLARQVDRYIDRQLLPCLACCLQIAGTVTTNLISFQRKIYIYMQILYIGIYSPISIIEKDQLLENEVMPL